jgi:hypothetical protein
MSKRRGHRAALGILVGLLLVAFFASAAFAGLASSPLSVKQPTAFAGLGSCPLGLRARLRVAQAE